MIFRYQTMGLIQCSKISVLLSEMHKAYWKRQKRETCGNWWLLSKRWVSCSSPIFGMHSTFKYKYEVVQPLWFEEQQYCEQAVLLLLVDIHNKIQPAGNKWGLYAGIPLRSVFRSKQLRFVADFLNIHPSSFAICTPLCGLLLVFKFPSIKIGGLNNYRVSQEMQISNSWDVIFEHALLVITTFY